MCNVRWFPTAQPLSSRLACQDVATTNSWNGADEQILGFSFFSRSIFRVAKDRSTKCGPNNVAESGMENKAVSCHPWVVRESGVELCQPQWSTATLCELTVYYCSICHECPYIKHNISESIVWVCWQHVFVEAFLVPPSQRPKIRRLGTWSENRGCHERPCC